MGSDNEDPGSEEVVGDKGMEGEGDEVCGITTFIPITHNQVCSVHGYGAGDYTPSLSRITNVCSN